ERVFAADPVAQPSEQERSQWADQESGGEQRDRAQQGRDRVSLLEEFDRQHGGQAPEDIEVIPFDDVSYRRSDDHGPEILWDLSGTCSHSHSHRVFLPIVRLIASRHADAPDRPPRNASSPFATIARTDVDRTKRPVSASRPRADQKQRK